MCVVATLILVIVLVVATLWFSLLLVNLLFSLSRLLVSPLFDLNLLLVSPLFSLNLLLVSLLRPCPEEDWMLPESRRLWTDITPLVLLWECLPCDGAPSWLLMLKTTPTLALEDTILACSLWARERTCTGRALELLVIITFVFIFVQIFCLQFV
jgi:hypothetical protein